MSMETEGMTHLHEESPYNRRLETIIACSVQHVVVESKSTFFPGRRPNVANLTTSSLFNFLFVLLSYNYNHNEPVKLNF